MGSAQPTRTLDLEETMSGNDQLAEAVLEAGNDGDVLAPSQLITLLAGLENPVQALMDWDQANQLFAAFDSEFGFINHARFARILIQPSDIVRYAALLRWLIRELRQWRRAHDNESRAVVAIVVAAQACDFDKSLWQLLPDEIAANADLVDYFKGVVAHSAVTINPLTSARPWEVEALAKFHEADAKGDWVGIMDGWTRLREFPFLANTLQTQATHFLYRYAMNDLVQAISNVRQSAPAMQIADAFGVDQRLSLALASDNPYFQLAAAYRSVTEPRNPRDRSEGLNALDQQLLSDLLIKVANDGTRWQAWMQILNTYPVRFPLLQVPLGTALARAPDSAIEPYVKSIWLYPKQAQADRGRRCVADCLMEFRAAATPERRRGLWTAAHTRWLEWNFNERDSSQHMFWVGWCDLDFALVGYACECINDTEREHMIQSIGRELQMFDKRWYASYTDIISTWNRLLSRLQPYAWASRLPAEDENWLTDNNQVCYPFNPETDKYTALKYRIP
jgi:hypothetical protein